MREKDLKENGLADMAYKVERDHEVQMARGDLYKIAKYGIKLHEMLKGVSEEQGLEGWVQAKITKAADYLGSVYHHLDYEMKFDEVSESKKADKFEPHTMYKDGKSKKANTEKDHKDLAKKGWSHDNPKTKKVEEAEEATMTVTNADKHTNSKAWQRYKAGDPKYKYDKDAVPDKPKTKTTDSKSYVDFLQSKLEEGLGGAAAGFAAGDSLPGKLAGAYVGHQVQSSLNKSENNIKKIVRALARKGIDINIEESVCTECGKQRFVDLPEEMQSQYESINEEKQKGVDGKVCWKGYKRMGTKKKGGKTVDNCVKM